MLISGLFALLVSFRIFQTAIASYMNVPTWPGFAIDGPEYFLPGFHLLLVWPIFVLVLLKRLLFARIGTILYLIIATYSVWVRSQGCFLGGDVCPPRPFWIKLMERLDWVDWAAFPVLILLLIVHLYVIVQQRRIQ